MHPIPQKPVERGFARRALAAMGLVRESDRDPLGEAGERVAAKHLRRLGYRVIGRNVRVPMGEADLLAIAPDRETVVLVEVKARRVAGDLVDQENQGTRAGKPVAHEENQGTRVGRPVPQPPPEASITAHKRAKLAEILQHLARANGWNRRPLRIDAVAVEWPPNGEPVVRHHAGAVAIAAAGGRPS